MKILNLLIMVLISSLAIAGCGGAAQADEESTDSQYMDELRGAVLNPPRSIRDFSLPATQDQRFTLSEHQGQVILVYFGYMTCPDVCPTTMAELRRVYLELEDLSQEVSVVFISVDPERDTLDKISAYTGAFHEDFIGVRSVDAAALEAVTTDFGVRVEKQEVDSALGYLVDHTASVFLIDPGGKLLEQFLYGTPYEDIAHDVEFILTNSA